MTARERVARAWHDGSDHAKDGTPFGGPLCNCQRVAERVMPMLAEAWTEGKGAGYSIGYLAKLDASRHLDYPNPYEPEENR